MKRISISQAPSQDEAVRRAVRVLSMVHELHKAGCQLLRIVPGMSGSGGAWRTAITLAGNLDPNHGALPIDWERTDGELWVHYSSGQENKYFGWTDAAGSSARGLAEKFVDRFPKLIELGIGRDWAYAGWYAEMLGRAEQGDLPMAYFETYGAPRAGCLPTTEHAYDSDLPLPPQPPGK